MTDVLPSIAAPVLAALPMLRGAAWHPLAGGRTNRLWRVGSVVVKSYDPAAATPLFPNDPAAEAQALTTLDGSGLAPTLLAAGNGWIAYAHVAGTVWQGDPAPVALALHRLHLHDPAGFRNLPSGSPAILAQGRAIAAQCKGLLPPMPPDCGTPPCAKPALLHGDAVPGNIIIGTKGLILIDWQCPAAGDPAEDLATFLSPAMQWLYRGRILTPNEVEQTLNAYPDRSITNRYRRLKPLFSWRMAAHCLWKAERGAADYATALRLELQDRAEPDAQGHQRPA